MQLARPFIRRPVATLLLAVALVIAGLVGLQGLPVSALPAVDFPVIEVTAAAPGASPDTMARSVTTPIETNLAKIPGVTSLSSVTASGTSRIVLRFAQDRDIDDAAQDVQAAIDASTTSLPEWLVHMPVYRKVNPAAPPIVTLAMTSDTMPPDELSRYARTIIVPRLSQIHGVGVVRTLGDTGRAVRVTLDPVAVNARGLSIEQVRAQLAEATSNAPKGRLEGRGQAYVLAADNQLLRANDYAQLLIRDARGSLVRLRDIARVADGVESDTAGAWSSGRRAIVFEVGQQVGANALDTVARIHARLPAILAALPGAVSLEVTSDASILVASSIRHTLFALGLSILLVTAILWLFLRQPRAVLIPAATIPLTLCGTIALMSAAGMSLNMMTLIALTVATGFVVDDAIVMVENVARHLEQGSSATEAALRGSRQISFTIVSLTLSVVSVFIPLIWMDGTIGLLLREFGMTIILAMIVSALISLTLTPAMCAWLLRDGLHRDLQSGPAPALYGGWLKKTMAAPGPVVAITAGLLLTTLALAWAMPKAFIPEQMTDRLQVTTRMNGAVSFAQLAARNRALASRLARDPAVAGVEVSVGNDRPGRGWATGQIVVRLTPQALREQDLTDITERLRITGRAVPGIVATWQPDQILQLNETGAGARNSLVVSGADLVEVERAARRLTRALAERAELSDVDWPGSAEGRALAVNVDRSRAIQLGLTMRDVGETLYSAFGQRQIADIYAPDGQYPLVIKIGNGAAAVDALDRTYVGAGATLVPLSVVARWTDIPSPLLIQRQDRFPAAEIGFAPALGWTLGQAVQEVEEVAASLKLPSKVVANFSGDAAELQDSGRGQGLLVLAAILTMYIVLGILYESFVHPLTILSTLPAAAAGGLIALALAGRSLDLLAFTGVLLLLAIVKKNAILVIDFAREEVRRAGASAAEAVVRACMIRFRPVLMTTAAAMVGAVPLILDDGPGAELRRPIGIAMIGGLLLAQALTLLSTPVIYVLLDRAGGVIDRRRPR